MLRKLRRLNELSLGEWLILLQLAAVSLIVAITLRLVSLPRLIDLTSRGAENRWVSRLPVFHHQSEISRLTNLTDIAAWITHSQGRCLMRSILLFWLLRARGEHAELLIGVSKETSDLESHAWIESQGRIMFDRPDMVGRFAMLLRF